MCTRLVAAAVVCVLAAGCASGRPAPTPGEYGAHYNQIIDLAQSWYVPHAGRPEYRVSEDMSAASGHMREQGYVLLGSSHFTRGEAQGPLTGDAVAHARALHAAVVVEQPPTLLGPTKAATARSDAAKAAAGPPVEVPAAKAGLEAEDLKIHSKPSAKAEPTAREPLPEQGALYDYHATYWVRPTNPQFGVLVEPLPAHLRGRIGQEHGVVATLVNRNGPAGQAGVREGDVLLAVEQAPVLDPARLDALIEARAGETVYLDLWRQGRFMRLRVPIGAGE